jgi:glycosyltransferase involved in cell wall biosynthesis
LSRHDEAGVPEGVPVALIEAMSMGKPVVATSTGATHELVKEILIDEEDIDAATEAIRRLITNPALHKEMGERNRRIIQDSYSENNIDKLFNILSKI